MHRPAATEIFYPDTAEPGSGARLYSRITEWIGAAREEVWVLGDGFSCADEAGIALAECYIAAYHRALERGARLVRVEDRSSGSAHWYHLLQATLAKYPGSFELYFIQDKQARIAARCFAIDPGGPDCRAMISHSEGFAATAGLSMLVSGDNKLAGFIRGSIREIVGGGKVLRVAAGELESLVK